MVIAFGSLNAPSPSSSSSAAAVVVVADFPWYRGQVKKRTMTEGLQSSPQAARNKDDGVFQSVSCFESYLPSAPRWCGIRHCRGASSAACLRSRSLAEVGTCPAHCSDFRKNPNHLSRLCSNLVVRHTCCGADHRSYYDEDLGMSLVQRNRMRSRSHWGPWEVVAGCSVMGLACRVAFLRQMNFRHQQKRWRDGLDSCIDYRQIGLDQSAIEASGCAS